jgi:hypothetical protein
MSSSKSEWPPSGRPLRAGAKVSCWHADKIREDQREKTLDRRRSNRMKSVDRDAINPSRQTQVRKPTSLRTNAPDSSSPTVSRNTDQIGMSQHAEEVSWLVARARELPEIRYDRVDLFKRLIDSNRYYRSSRVIAEAIIANEM